MPLVFPLLAILRKLWGRPPGLRGTPSSRIRNNGVSVLQGASRPTGASAAVQGDRPTIYAGAQHRKNEWHWVANLVANGRPGQHPAPQRYSLYLPCALGPDNRQLYDSMLQHVKEAGIASALHASNVRVIDPATPPARPYKPSLFLNSVLGLFAGGFFAIVLIVLRERADRSIQAPGEASLYLDVPELGVLPSVDAARSQSFAYYRQARGAETKKTEKENRKSPVELVTWKSRPSVLADSFRSTLTSILFSGENGNRPRVIALTSANPQEGKTTVASNLALALAEIGRKVLLIDADLRKPRLHEIFNVSNAWGLSDLLDGTKPPEGLEAMVAGTVYRDLYVLPAGSAASSISNLLHSPRALDLLQRMRREFDMVIIDTPPMLQMPDARVLGRLADAVILVVRSASTTKETVAAAGQRLAEDGTRLLGTVLNEWDPRKTSHAGREYGYRPYTYHESRPGGE